MKPIKIYTHYGKNWTFWDKLEIDLDFQDQCHN